MRRKKLRVFLLRFSIAATLWLNVQAMMILSEMHAKMKQKNCEQKLNLSRKIAKQQHPCVCCLNFAFMSFPLPRFLCNL